MKEIYTIGYSGFKVDDFVDTLKFYHINSLIDVRSNPNSKFFEDYNEYNLKRILKLNGIIYRNYKREFGARQEEICYYPNGYLDFEIFTKSEQFLDGVKKIEKGMNLNYRFAFMCAEKDPSTCHRNIMVARTFYNKGYDVKNILSDGSYEDQASIENRLVNHYYPNKNQLSLFSEQMTMQEMVENSYRKRNEEIGFKIEDYSKVKAL